MDVERRSAWVKVRVKPAALVEVQGFVGDEGLSTWLRQLMGWAVANGWRPGQSWKRQWVPPGGQGVGVQAPLEAARGPLLDEDVPEVPPDNEWDSA